MCILNLVKLGSFTYLVPVILVVHWESGPVVPLPLALSVILELIYQLHKLNVMHLFRLMILQGLVLHDRFIVRHISK